MELCAFVHVRLVPLVVSFVSRNSFGVQMQCQPERLAVVLFDACGHATWKQGSLCDCIAAIFGFCSGQTIPEAHLKTQLYIYISRRVHLRL